MKKMLSVLAITLSFAIPVSVQAEDAQSILDEMLAKDSARKSGVEFYAVRQKAMGQTVSRYFERTEVQLPDGSSTDAFRSVSSSELKSRSGGQGPALTPAQMEIYAQGLEQTGAGISTEMEKGLKSAGLPPNMLKSMGSPSEPWASPDPKTMMGASAGFVRAAGQASAETGKGQEDAQTLSNQMAEFGQTAKLVGKEKINGKNAFHLRSDDVNQTQVSNGQEFTIQTMHFWVDTAEYVPLKMRMEGTAKMEGQVRDVFVEQLWSDYRTVPGSEMYESYKQLMRMGGVLTPKEEAQMLEAKQKMAEFEAQMAAMPDSQRKMMESMMGSQMDMMRKMVSGGAFEIETEVTEIQIIE